MLIDDYLEYQVNYEKKYGNKTIILMQVGGEPSDISKISQSVAEGNINHSFEDAKPATGIYASIQQMVNSLNNTLGSVSAASNQIASGSGQIAS